MATNRLTIALAAVAALLASMLLAACGGTARPAQSGSPAGPLPARLVATNSDVSVGPNRFGFALKDSAGQPVGSPAMQSTFFLYDSSNPSDKPVAEAPGSFNWVREPERGIFTANLDLPHAGSWEIEMVTAVPGGSEIRLRTRVDAKPVSATPAIGATAPPSTTKTVTDANGDLRTITTDDNPDPALYAMTVREAVTSGRPSVIVFATPARCTSSMCGPTLEAVKRVKTVEPDVNFVHVEIYDKPQDFTDTSIVSAVGDWNLPTEPWVFVVDRAGKVTAKFESFVSDAELRAAIASARKI